MSEVGKVLAAFAEVLKSLHVSADGTLPGNMGGKKYITAKDIGDAVKTKFSENNLIMLPSETIAAESIQEGKDGRRTSYITITGEYRIVHIEDGSEVVITGTGAGMAVGTAVAPNIASTFALKNALQRAFLISENAVEESALKAQEVAAATPPQKRLEEEQASTGAAEKTAIKKQIAESLGLKSGPAIKAKGAEFFGEGVEWSEDLAALKKWAAHLKTGEVA